MIASHVYYRVLCNRVKAFALKVKGRILAGERLLLNMNSLEMRNRLEPQQTEFSGDIVYSLRFIGGHRLTSAEFVRTYGPDPVSEIIAIFWYANLGLPSGSQILQGAF